MHVLFCEFVAGELELESWDEQVVVFVVVGGAGRGFGLL
jgi:hypothetical protein